MGAQKEKNIFRWRTQSRTGAVQNDAIDNQSDLFVPRSTNWKRDCRIPS